MVVKIAVIIPTYNGWRTLNNCLRSILNQSLKASEIIVVDNASTDDTYKNIKKNYLSVKLVRLPTNTGVTGGRNAGIKTAGKKNNYFFFFDHDMIADNRMLEELVRVAGFDGSIGIVTPKIYYWKDKKRIWSAGTGINLWTGRVIFRGGKDTGQYNKVEEVQVAPAAMLIKRKVIEKIKKFDDKYFATYEDTDFCFRARKFGFKTFYAPEAVAYHDLPTSKKDEAKRLLGRAYRVGRNRVLFMKDFGKNFLVFLLFIPIFTLYYLKMAIKYDNLSGWKDFVRGTIAGIFSNA